MSNPGGSAPHQRELASAAGLRYLLWLPPDRPEEATGARPLLLFLHGAGERGNNLALVRQHGPPRRIDEGVELPFIVVSPQCPPEQSWSPEALGALLDEVEATHAVDAERVYVTGLSMGGFGTWRLAAATPDRFAAIAPVCGGGDRASAPRLARIPIWAFHGAKDDVVPLRRSEEMVEAVRRAGGDVRFTVYPDAWHDSWTETYANPALYDWLLSHTRTAGDA